MSPLFLHLKIYYTICFTIYPNEFYSSLLYPFVLQRMHPITSVGISTFSKSRIVLLFGLLHIKSHSLLIYLNIINPSKFRDNYRTNPCFDFLSYIGNAPFLLTTYTLTIIFNQNIRLNLLNNFAILLSLFST